MTARGDAMMDLYTVAEEAYFAHADTVSTNGIGAAVDAVLDELRAQVKARRTDAWNAHHMTDASDCSQRDFTEGAAETSRERCKICDLIARVREDERDGWGSSDKWRHVQRVQREVRHHIAGLLATEPADRLREADGAEFILLADAQRIARGGAR